MDQEINGDPINTKKGCKLYETFECDIYFLYREELGFNNIISKSVKSQIQFTNKPPEERSKDKN